MSSKRKIRERREIKAAEGGRESKEKVTVPSAENLSMAWLRVRKFPVDLDICSMKETDVSSHTLRGLPSHTITPCLKLQKTTAKQLQKLKLLKPLRKL